MLLEALNRQEKNGFVSQTGLLALKDLLERKGLLVRGGAPRPLGDARRPPHGRAWRSASASSSARSGCSAASRASAASVSRASSRMPSSRSTRSTPEKAVRALEEAFRLDKTNAELAFYLGETRVQRGRDGARRAAPATRCSRASRDHFEALVYTGVLENEAGRTDRALDVLKRAVAVKPDAFLPYFAWARSSRCGASWRARRRSCGRPSSIDENPQAFSLLGTIAYERGQPRRSDEGVPEGRAPRPGRRGRALPARPRATSTAAGRRRQRSASSPRSS